MSSKEQIVSILELNEEQHDFIVGILKRDKVDIENRMAKLQSYSECVNGVTAYNDELKTLREKYQTGDEILNLLNG
ncbi:MAG: hypothetical protein CMM02_11135 [Rhodopirellula sp.]|jgi:hypothetical protein|nr:hypothetical protein [Rhodopirellula sp.]